MLIVRRVPHRGVGIRATLTTVEGLVALVVAHAVAGGALPSRGWVLMAVPALYVASWLVLSGRARIRVVLPGLVAVQLFGHAWLEALASHDHAAHGDATVGLSGAMVGAHLAAGLVTTIAWALRRRIGDRLGCWLGFPCSAVPPRHSRVSACRQRAVGTADLLAAAPTRGPPSAYVLAA